MISDNLRQTIKARAYVEDVLASLVPSDDDFDQIWNLIPDHIAQMMQDGRYAELGTTYIDLEAHIREIKDRRVAIRADRREG